MIHVYILVILNLTFWQENYCIMIKFVQNTRENAIFVFNFTEIPKVYMKITGKTQKSFSFELQNVKEIRKISIVLLKLWNLLFFLKNLL